MQTHLNNSSKNLKLEHICKFGDISLNLEKLSPEDKVNLLINMVDVCTRISADAIKEQNKTIGEKELVEKLRARIQFCKRRYRGLRN